MKVPAKKDFEGLDGYGRPFDKNSPPPPAHPSGTANAVIVDYVDMGMCERDAYQGNGRKETVHLCKFVLQLAKTMPEPDGRRYLLAFKPFGVLLSLDPKAALRGFLESVAGRAFEVEEDIDFESFVGKPCVVIVKHKLNADGTRTYANIESAGPHMEGLPALQAEGYVRVKDRAAGQQGSASPIPNDSDIPF
jgi:hypothetical protein